MTVHFGPYDAAQAKMKAKGIQTLGLLTFSGTDRTHEDWKNYVQTVVSHFGPDIPAWEIMNEADNYLSPADYTVYLREAHDVIKAINPNATIVLSGITSRPEAPNFWNGVSAAGGWNAFDVVGLHVYHSGNPEKVNFGGGDLLAEYDRALASIKKNGGGKKIWITETGYAAGSVGNENQAYWLARTLIMTRSVSAIEKVFVYRLYDDGRETYGLTDAAMNERPAYDVVRDVLTHLSGLGTRLYPQSQQLIDRLDTVNGWSTKATTNGSATLSAAEGQSGNGMRISYNFTADQAYAVAEKNISIPGTPQAIAAWFYGDDTKNVWKYRFKDAKGETFQADIGNLVSGWSYKQFTIGHDTAVVSWGGDGVIDYPISFNSIVVDRQGGEPNGSGIVDEIAAIYNGADLQAYQFGGTIAYWTTGEPTTIDFCGGSKQFTASPQFAAATNCTTSEKSVNTSSVTIATKSKAALTKKPVSTASPLPEISAETSTFRVDGSAVVADGKQSYRLVMLLKTATGELVKNQQPSISLSPTNEAVTMSGPVLVGDEWWVTLTSTAPADISVIISSGQKQLQTIPLQFMAVSTAAPTELPTAASVPVVVEGRQTGINRVNHWLYPALVVGGIGCIAGILAVVLWYGYRRRGVMTPPLSWRSLWLTARKPINNGKKS